MGSAGLTLAASPDPSPSPDASDRSRSPDGSGSPYQSRSPDASDRSRSPDPSGSPYPSRSPDLSDSLVPARSSVRSRASSPPEPPPSSLPSLELAGAVVDVAPRLLGARLVHGDVVVRLTEVEAYAGESDPGSHAFRGRTARTEVMFGRAGVAYVYVSYGMHWCMNVVTGAEGTASAVLLRAGEVVDGLESARSRRPGARDRDLARGPARLTRALGVDGSFGGTDLLDPRAPLRLLPPLTPADPAGVLAGPRVGVAGLGAPTPWRFWLAGDPTVSPYRPAAPRRRPRQR